MKTFKVLGMKDCWGCYFNDKDIVMVDYQYGIFKAFLVTFHEYIHVILAKLHVEDWLDLNLIPFPLVSKQHIIAWSKSVPHFFTKDFWAFPYDYYLRDKKGELWHVCYNYWTREWFVDPVPEYKRKE